MHRTITTTQRVTIRLLGRFDVVVDGTPTPSDGWSRRTAAALVKVLALAPGQRLHREQVIDILWPDDSPAVAAPKLHKAAHYARQAAGRNDAIVLRGEVVHVFPGAELTVDVVEFDELSRQALADHDGATAAAALGHYGGELLPDDLYEDWAAERRELLRLRHLSLLRLAGRWQELSELDPTDEHAHIEVMRHHLAHGDPGSARRQYERLAQVVSSEVGSRPVSVSPYGAAIEDLIAELTELTRRQATLLQALAAAGAEAAVCAAAGP
jgi:DNA-binding SARP family transcriptional activator